MDIINFNNSKKSVISKLLFIPLCLADQFYYLFNLPQNMSLKKPFPRVARRCSLFTYSAADASSFVI